MKVADLMARHVEFIEPAPEPYLRPSDTIFTVSHHFAGTSTEFFYVSGDGVRLDGLIRRNAKTSISDFVTVRKAEIKVD